MTKVLKVCFIGADGTGKTSIILRYTKNTFSTSYLATIGCDFYEISYPNEGDPIQVYLWDIASQKNFEIMRQHYLAYSHLTIVCVDINRNTDEFISPWINDLKKYVSPDAEYILVLNKIDLEPKIERIKELQTQYEQKYKVPVLITSAKTGENIGILFEEIGKKLHIIGENQKI
jgi:small GTP-binding protein